MKKHRLILYAHGSKDPRWREPFEQLEADLRADLGDNRVRLAYMEFIAPTLAEVVAEAVREGIQHMSLLPVFMATGAHLATDLPEQVEAVRTQFPEVELKVLAAAGEDPRLVAVLHTLARESAECCS